jgi:tripartite-type tricarboxylate transporter receptor subunit TctC
LTNLPGGGGREAVSDIVALREGERREEIERESRREIRREKE